MIKAVLFDLGDTLITELEVNGPYIWQSKLKKAEGIDMLLKDLTGRFRLGIISNTTVAREVDIVKTLNSVQLNGIFEVILTSVDMECEKPSPEIFLEATRRLHVKPQECIMVGNRIDADVLGGNQVGMKTILFTWASDDRTVPITPEEQPFGVARSAAEVRMLIDQISWIS